MKEYKDVANINFRFKEKSYPCDYVSGLAQILYDYPIEDILIVEHLFLQWKPDLIKCIIEQWATKSRLFKEGKKTRLSPV